MKYVELYNLVPKVFAENLGELDRARAHANELLAAADNEELKEQGRALMKMIDTRMVTVARIADRIQKEVRELALLCHQNEGFEIPNYQPEEYAEADKMPNFVPDNPSYEVVKE